MNYTADNIIEKKALIHITSQRCDNDVKSFNRIIKYSQFFTSTWIGRGHPLKGVVDCYWTNNLRGYPLFQVQFYMIAKHHHIFRSQRQ